MFNLQKTKEKKCIFQIWQLLRLDNLSLKLKQILPWLSEVEEMSQAASYISATSPVCSFRVLTTQPDNQNDSLPSGFVCSITSSLQPPSQLTSYSLPGKCFFIFSSFILSNDNPSFFRYVTITYCRIHMSGWLLTLALSALMQKKTVMRNKTKCQSMSKNLSV